MTTLGFIPEPLTIPLDRILPSRKIPEGLLGSRKFKQIKSSIDAVGLIEPLIIGQADKTSGLHVLLDGHIRLLLLREMEFTDAPVSWRPTMKAIRTTIASTGSPPSRNISWSVGRSNAG
jgi:ParB-like chromosome segregation protein Spo0J